MARRKRKGCFWNIAVLGFLILFFAVSFIAGNRMLRRYLDLPKTEPQIPYQEVSVTQERFEKKFYYESLPEEKQLIYREILQGILDEEEEIYLHSADAGQNNELFQFVLNDYPEIFWCDGRGNTTVYQKREEGYSVLAPEYQYKGEEKAQKERKLQEKADEILASAPMQGSEYEKIRYVYEYVIRNCEYQEGTDDNQNIISTLLNGKSVCAGYARSLQYLLERMDIFCTYITGTAVRPDTEESVPHAWNLVYCDGAYYYVDATWGDPVSSEKSEDTIVYDYLCMEDTELFQTHTIDTGVDVPECSSKQYNYYILNDMYYVEYNRELILQKMIESVENQEEVIFKFDNKTVYEEAKEEIFGTLMQETAEFAGRKYGVKRLEYTYQDDTVLNKITILWKIRT